jgi:DNA-binding NtrC family response regulator
MKILVVDDEKDIQTLFEQKLERKSLSWFSLFRAKMP